MHANRAVALLGGVTMLLCAACTPIQRGIVVIPTPAQATDSSAHAIAILQRVVAARGFHAWAAPDASEQHWVACHVKKGITICAKRFGAETHIRLTSPSSEARDLNALSATLLDTLSAHFGYTQVRECAWHETWLAGCDAVARDSIETAFIDSVRATGKHHPVDVCPCVVLLAAVPFLIPNVFALARKDTADTTIGPLGRRSRVTFRVAGGLDQPRDSALLSSTYSLGAEYLGRHILVEARQQEIDVPGAVRMRSVHVGPTFGDSALIGAVTFGYRWIGGTAASEGRIAGPEIGLPLIIFYGRSLFRLDASYVFNAHGSNWNYRFQWERDTARHILYGWKLETTSTPLNYRTDIAWTAVSMIVGVRR